MRSACRPMLLGSTRILEFHPGHQLIRPMSFWKKTYFPQPGTERLPDRGNYAATRSRFYARQHSNLRYLIRERYAWMNPYLAGKAAVVELGAGPGLSRDVLSCPVELTDVLDNDWIDRQVDAGSLPYAPASLDAVICSHMIHHVARPAALLRDIAMALKPGGVLLINETVTSLCHRLLMWGMRHEGWSYEVDLFDAGQSAKNAGDPLSGNNAVASLLFDDAARFTREFPNLAIERHEYNELLIGLLSGGVGGQVRMIDLPGAMLDLVRAFDRLLARGGPRVFALARRVVIRSS